MHSPPKENVNGGSYGLLPGSYQMKKKFMTPMPSMETNIDLRTAAPAVINNCSTQFNFTQISCGPSATTNFTSPLKGTNNVNPFR